MKYLKSGRMCSTHRVEEVSLLPSPYTPSNRRCGYSVVIRMPCGSAPCNNLGSKEKASKQAHNSTHTTTKTVTIVLININTTSYQYARCWARSKIIRSPGASLPMIRTLQESLGSRVYTNRIGFSSGVLSDF